MEVRKQDRLASSDPPVRVKRWRQLGREPLDPLRAERAARLVLPREGLEVEVARGHQATVGQDPRGVARQWVDPDVDLGTHHLAVSAVIISATSRRCSSSIGILTACRLSLERGADTFRSLREFRVVRRLGLPEVQTADVVDRHQMEVSVRDLDPNHRHPDLLRARRLLNGLRHRSSEDKSPDRRGSGRSNRSSISRFGITRLWPALIGRTSRNAR